jgi:hypothetical protein
MTRRLETGDLFGASGNWMPLISSNGEDGIVPPFPLQQGPVPGRE